MGRYRRRRKYRRKKNYSRKKSIRKIKFKKSKRFRRKRRMKPVIYPVKAELKRIKVDTQRPVEDPATNNYYN